MVYRPVTHFDRLVWFAGIFVVAAVFILYLFNPRFMQELDFVYYDQVISLKKVSEGSADVVIVDIDDRSLEVVGQWPWPRYILAKLFAEINAQKPSAVGVDILFPEPDRHSPDQLFQELREVVDTGELSKLLPDNLHSYDELLSQRMVEGLYVLANRVMYSDNSPIQADCHPQTLDLSADVLTALRQSLTLIQSEKILCAISELENSAKLSGFINVSPDIDGVLRKVPLLVDTTQGVVPSLAFASWLQSKQQNVFGVVREGDHISALRINNTTIPIDSNAQLWLNLRGNSPQYRYVPAHEVLKGVVDRNVFQNRIVLVGTSAAGIGDFSATSYEPVMPSIEIHAAVIDNLESSDGIIRPYYAPGVEIFVLFLTAIITVLVVTRMSALIGVFLIGGVGGLLVLASLGLLHFHLVYISPLYSIACLIFLSVVLFSLQYYLAERRGGNLVKQLAQTQSATIRTIAALAETRDLETGAHLLRTESYMRALATRLSKDPRYARLVSLDDVEQISTMAPLHDIGKVGIPDAVLQKPGTLTEAEMEVMRTHPVLGRDILMTGADQLKDDSFLKYAVDIAWCHHEKWDGSGYPRGISGEDIPLAARLMAIADVYDALINKRVYKAAFDHRKSLEIMREGRGSHFDPQIFDIFLELEDEFLRIANQYPDTA